MTAMMPVAPPYEVATVCLRVMAMSHRVRDVGDEVAALRARVDAAEAALLVCAARVDRLTAQLGGRGVDGDWVESAARPSGAT